MTKMKEKLYENRFGLFFFLFLLAYSLIVTGSLRLWNMDDAMYCFHILDFSVGFCTKLLPGAICNFIFGDPTRTQVAAYLMVMSIVCYLMVGLLVGKVLSESKEEYRFYIFAFLILFLTGPVTFADYTGLDFYWIIAAVFAVFCLQKKQTYFLVVPAMIFAIMAHFAGIICYVPFVAVFMLYKISVTKEKKEKKLLWALWWIVVVSTIGLSVYMAAYEVDNVKITIEELKDLLASKDIRDIRYYYFAFFRDEAVEKLSDIYAGAPTQNIGNIDMTQSGLKILIDMIKQQIQVNEAFVNYHGDLKYFLIIIPVIAVIYRCIWSVFKGSGENKLKQFSIFCSGALFLVCLFFGLLFSTDTIRWIAHAFTPFIAFFIYVFYKEVDERKKDISNSLKKIPDVVILGYLAIYAVSANFC